MEQLDNAKKLIGAAMTGIKTQIALDMLLQSIEEINKAESEINGYVKINTHAPYTVKCDVCGCSPSIYIQTQYGTFCQAHARY